MTSVLILGTSAHSPAIRAIADLRQEYLAKPWMLAISMINRALDSCRKVLGQSRRNGHLAAFIHMLGHSAFFGRATPFVPRIEDCERDRNERVFERSSPSCYCCEALAPLLSQRRGGIVPAGIAGETACLSASAETLDRNRKVIYLCDASAGHALNETVADQVHSPVSKISGVYGEVYETADGTASTLSRKLSNGKNAGG